MAMTIMDDETRWETVLRRDPVVDVPFVYAVRSTGVYCRPACPSRRPSRSQVMFFALPREAERAGYRPCRRCRPDSYQSDRAIAERVCQYIEAHLDDPLTLDDLAHIADLSPHHLQRVFKRVTGISPRQYVDAHRMKQLKSSLRSGAAVTTALYDAGYGSSSRMYERAPSHLGMTPTAYRRGGEGMQIGYAIVSSRLGRLLVAGTERGISAVYLGDDDAELERQLHAEFPRAQLTPDAELTRWVDPLINHLDGTLPRLDLPLDVQATAFQWRVWQELLGIPYGTTRTYKEVAERLGMPTAARAVARACATNPASVVIPCHRVVRGDGGLGGYRWGLQRKRALQEQERADAEKNSERRTG